MVPMDSSGEKTPSNLMPFWVDGLGVLTDVSHLTNFEFSIAPVFIVLANASFSEHNGSGY